ncbi:MAG: hypothetical protein ACRENP_08070, partial [Longimicrobiales bacterium]
MEQLANGGSIDTIGVTTAHPSAHWGTPQMNAAIRELADSLALRAQFFVNNPDSLGTGQVFPAVLQVNDLSLLLGGILDISDLNWDGDHVGHRRGQNADLRIRGTEHNKYREIARYIWEEILDR